MFRRLAMTALCVLAVAAPALAGSYRVQPGTGVRLPDPEGREARIHHDLLDLRDDVRAGRALRRPAGPRNPLMRLSGPADDPLVAVDVLAVDDPQALAGSLEALGMQKVRVFGRMISGRLPASAVDGLADLPGMLAARPVLALNRAGLTTTQGDAAMRADDARAAYPTAGSGVRVGVLSDSYDCKGGAAGDIANGDLAADVLVVDEGTCQASDEGRAMLQIVHDVAPGSTLAFHTAFDGEAAFAQGILDLQAAGCRVIVDDIIYLSEPMFQDGIIAQAADAAVAAGASYLSSAGNEGRNSYEAPFRASGTSLVVGSTNYGEAHDFDPGSGTDIFQGLTLDNNKTLLLSVQWDQPFASAGGSGSASNINVLLLDAAATTVVKAATVNNRFGDAVETLSYTNTSGATQTLNLAIVKQGVFGPIPGLVKYISFDSGTFTEYVTNSPTLFGHANAAGAVAVGASWYITTPEFTGNPASVPTLQSFSAIGGVPILFDTNGTRLASQELRQKPDIVAPDGGNTTFFGSDRSEDTDTFPNFFGTSAAAPHAAAVAALMFAQFPQLTTQEVTASLKAGCLDMDHPFISGFQTGEDFATGSGFLFADAALAAAQQAAPPVPAMGPAGLAMACGLALLAARRLGRAS